MSLPKNTLTLEVQINGGREKNFKDSMLWSREFICSSFIGGFYLLSLQSYSSSSSLDTVCPCPRCEACDVVILQLRSENEKLREMVEEQDRIKREVRYTSRR